MIRPLRRIHLRTWSLFAVLLPVGIISAWLSVPSLPAYKLFQPVQAEPLPVVVRTIKTEDHIINLRSDASHHSYQLEWINITALSAPSALIYRTKNNGDVENAEIIGRIDPRGLYRFSLKNDTTGNSHFVVYDIIHHRVIEKINF